LYLLYRITQIRRKSLPVFTFSFYFKTFASPAGGLRNCNAAAFASFKKYAIAFFESRLRRDRTKRCGLCNYWFKIESSLTDPNVSGNAFAPYLGNPITLFISFIPIPTSFSIK
jgi:hypothetical protein